jgi:hypothetical protein
VAIISSFEVQATTVAHPMQNARDDLGGLPGQVGDAAQLGA